MLALIFASGLALPAVKPAANSHGRRRLSETPILNYEPASQVTDHNNVDLDQDKIQTYLSTPFYDDAEAVYTNGAYSKPSAKCTLMTPGPTTVGQTVSKKAAVYLVTKNGDWVTGKTASAYTSTDTEVKFTYPVSSLRVQPVDTQCYEGGLRAGDESTMGCIAVSGGGMSTFEISGTWYNATCSNYGGRTLSGFSTKAQALMYECGPFTHYDPSDSYQIGCPYTSYLPYYEYYGQFDYADQIVMAALKGGNTSNLQRGKFSFEGLEDATRVQVAQKGTAYLNAWMYAIREFEDAIDDCAQNDPLDNALSSGPVHAWDEGVAFFTGSLLTADDLLEPNLPVLDKQGVMAYTLGNKRCKNFRTCGEYGNMDVGEAYVNIELFKLFRTGRDLIQGDSNCEAAIPVKDDIVKLMTVPLVQGTLRYAYKVGVQNGNAKAKAEGAIFAAAILPQLHKCDPAAATLVYDELNMNSDNTLDFNLVKKTMEDCYESMGITCQQVGGLIDTATNTYYKGAGGEDATPCGAPAPAPGTEWEEAARAAGWAPCKKTVVASRRRMTEKAAPAPEFKEAANQATDDE